jgi:hypothetical protein
MNYFEDDKKTIVKSDLFDVYAEEWAKKFGLTAEQLNNYRYEVVQDEREKAKQAEKNNQ